MSSGTLSTTLVAAMIFIGRIAVHIELGAGPADLARQGPDMNPCERAHYMGIVEIHRDATELGEFGELPEDYRRHAPAVGRKQARLRRPQCAGHRIEQDVGIKIENPSGSRWTECCP